VLPEALIRVEAKRPRGSTVVGQVAVQVTLRANGQIDKATAISGPSSLREIAEEAAQQWAFFVDDKTTLAVGLITFDFTQRNRVSTSRYTFTFRECCARGLGGGSPRAELAVAPEPAHAMSLGSTNVVAPAR